MEESSWLLMNLGMFLMNLRVIHQSTNYLLSTYYMWTMFLDWGTEVIKTVSIPTLK